MLCCEVRAEQNSEAPNDLNNVTPRFGVPVENVICERDADKGYDAQHQQRAGYDWISRFSDPSQPAENALHPLLGSQGFTTSTAPHAD